MVFHGRFLATGQPQWDLGLAGSGTGLLAPTETIKHAIENSDPLLSAMPAMIKCGDARCHCRR